MLKRALLALFCLLFAIAWQAPASLANSILYDLSKGDVALLNTQGSLWSGTGMLAVPDPATNRLTPFIRVQWSWQASYLLQGQLRWQFAIGGQAPGAVTLSLRGPSLEMLRISLPARYALERMPNAVGRAGWHGDVSLFVQNWQCNWKGLCKGDADLQWLGVGSDLFPDRKFGDYQLNAHAQDGFIDLQLTTIRGEIQIQANGKLEPPEHFEFSGNISGDPSFVGRLPDISGNVVVPDGAPGHMRFSVKR